MTAESVALGDNLAATGAPQLGGHLNGDHEPIARFRQNLNFLGFAHDALVATLKDRGCRTATSIVRYAPKPVMPA